MIQSEFNKEKSEKKVSKVPEACEIHQVYQHTHNESPRRRGKEIVYLKK
jgi:hypothetical protein